MRPDRAGSLAATLLALATACAEADPGGSSAADADAGSSGTRDLPQNLPSNDAAPDAPDSDASSGVTDAAQDAAADLAPEVLPDLPADEPDLGVEPDQPDLVTVDAADLDPCQGTASCAAAGTRCDADDLVVCAENLDGCLVETRVDCGAAGDECVETAGDADCVPPGVGDGGDTCADALPLAIGVHSYNTTGFTNNYDDFDGCESLAWSDGPDLVLSYSLPAGATLTVSMEDPEGDWNVVAAIGDACPDLETFCVDFSDESIFLNPEQVVATNTTGSVRTYWVVVDGWDVDDFGPVTVSASVTGP